MCFSWRVPEDHEWCPHPHSPHSQDSCNIKADESNNLKLQSFPLPDGALAWGCEGALGTRRTVSSLVVCLGGQEMAPQRSFPNGKTPLGRVLSYRNPTKRPPATLRLVPPNVHMNSQVISGRIRAPSVCSSICILLVLLLVDHKWQLLQVLRLRFWTTTTAWHFR